jgi:hypothetical protein
MKKITKTRRAVIIESYETGAAKARFVKLGLGYAPLRNAHEAAARKRRVSR